MIIKSNPASINIGSSTGTSGQTGLVFPGDGNARRMFYWDLKQYINNGVKGPDFIDIYPATYIFKVKPKGHKSFISDTVNGHDRSYWTTFFWGNNGDFTWDINVGANTYYGAHPYPYFESSSTRSAQNWEISVYGQDISFNVPNYSAEVSPWDVWYTQVFRAYKDASGNFVHEFFFNVTNGQLGNAIRYTIPSNDSAWSKRLPPYPSIVMGQAPDKNGPPEAGTSLSGASWGGYAGWEEFYGVMRGIQIYKGKLSDSEVLAELASPKSTANGLSTIWYMNLNPRPDDISDKKGVGTPHNPKWDLRSYPTGTLFPPTVTLWTG